MRFLKVILYSGLQPETKIVVLRISRPRLQTTSLASVTQAIYFCKLVSTVSYRMALPKLLHSMSFFNIC